MIGCVGFESCVKGRCRLLFVINFILWVVYFIGIGFDLINRFLCRVIKCWLMIVVLLNLLFSVKCIIFVMLVVVILLVIEIIFCFLSLMNLRFVVLLLLSRIKFFLYILWCFVIWFKLLVVFFSVIMFLILDKWVMVFGCIFIVVCFGMLYKIMGILVFCVIVL